MSRSEPTEAGADTPTIDHLPDGEATLAFESSEGPVPIPATSPAGAPDDYEILREIARGGMGVVFQARQRSLNRQVALKMMLAGSYATEASIVRFRREAEAAAHLDHPGIVPIHEIGVRDGLPFFAMGYVDGPSLADRLAEGPLPQREAAELIKRVAEAVQYAHDRGVVHRDLKPANILLDPQTGPRVTDFGLAKRQADDSQLTATGQVLGTPSYMPPEQATGDQEVGPTADVYALGAVLYAAIVGRPPFQAASPMETLSQVLHQDPAPPRQLNRSVGRDLETIALKCLEKDPSRRYATARELAADLSRYLNGRPISARASALPYGVRVWVKSRLKRTFWVALMAAISTLATVYVVVSILLRDLLDLMLQVYARSFPGLRPPAILGGLGRWALPSPEDETLQVVLISGVILLASLLRGPLFAYLARPSDRWDDLVSGLVGGLVSGALLAGLLGPILGVVMGSVYSRPDFELLGDAMSVDRRPNRSETVIDPLVEHYPDLARVPARSRGHRMAAKAQADGVSGQLAGAVFGLFTALALGPGLSLAEALVAGPLHRRNALFPAYAELIVPTLGAVYGLFLIVLALLAVNTDVRAEMATFLWLTTLLSLSMALLAAYLVARQIHWIKRWLIYIVAFGCLAAIALSAYE